jgi:hypothetical protein
MALTYATPKLQAACQGDPMIMNKIAVIVSDQPLYGTPGPSGLWPHARHAHYTNGFGIAWKYGGVPYGSDVEILALGKKDNKAAANMSQYSWSNKGKM